MAKLLLLRVKGALSHRDQVDFVECNELDDFYKYLECDCFDVANRRIGNKRYDIFVDDTGLFDEHPVVSAVENGTNKPMLVGNLIFANHDDAGNTTDLSDEDVVNIMRNLHMMFDGDKLLLRLVCNY